MRVDPPPDLAIEVDISSSSLDQLSIYADLGVPEVWLYDGETLKVYQLQSEGEYTQQTRSPSFPFLPLDEVERFLARRNETDETTWIWSFREWVKTLGQRQEKGHGLIGDEMKDPIVAEVRQHRMEHTISDSTAISL